MDPDESRWFNIRYLLISQTRRTHGYETRTVVHVQSSSNKVVMHICRVTANNASLTHGKRVPRITVNVVAHAFR